MIRMLPGTHNGLGRSAVIDKRVLIDGRSGRGNGSGSGSSASISSLALSTTTTALDARGNTPALRFRRAAAVVGLTIDATGFREAVRVDSLPSGGSASGALLAGCSVSSSGDDGVVVAGKLALLTLVDCEVRAGKAGVRAFAGGEVCLKRCSVRECGTHGLAAQALSPSSPFLSSSSPSSSSLGVGGKISARETKISSCREEGALCSGAGSSLVLEGVEIDRCRGPAVDASGRGCSVLLRGGGGKGGEKGNKISGRFGGGLWLWQGARARVCGAGTVISCDETFAVLTDGKGTRLEIEKGCCCEVRGGLKGAEAERAVLVAAAAAAARSENEENEDESNSAAATTTTEQQRRHCGPPPEVGPFRWDGPDPLRAE